MPWAAIIGAGVGLYSSHRNRQAAEEAARLQQNATNLSAEELRRQYEIGQNNLAPWMRAGRGALTEQQKLMGLGLGGAEGSAESLAALQSSPGYQFRLQQGQQGLESGLAARGGMGSGKSMAAGNEYNQNFASNEYNNRLNQLASLSGTGQTTASGMANLGANYGQNMGNIWQGNANAQGAAGIAGVNATQSGLLGGIGAGLGLYNATHPQPNYWNTSSLNNQWNYSNSPSHQSSQNWATSNNPNYNGPGFNNPYAPP